MKIAVCAGHGINTAGKRTPDDEREWSFNNKVVIAFIAELNTYENVSILRTDDPTGATDVSLTSRTDQANNWGADIYVSFHHNANTGDWGTWTGTETYTHLIASSNSDRLAALVQPELIKAYGLRDRGLKKADFHILRETWMPAILTEGGYMDSSIDILKLRDNTVLANAGINTAKAVSVYGNLVKKPALQDTKHTVVSGDTLWALSVKYNSTVDDIKIWNGLTSNTINIGMVLIVKKHKATVVAPKPVKPSKPIVKPISKPIAKPKPKPTGIESVGRIKIVNLNHFTYIYAKTNDNSTRLGKAIKYSIHDISGSVPGWYEVIFKGRRAYVKAKYAKRI